MILYYIILYYIILYYIKLYYIMYTYVSMLIYIYVSIYMYYPQSCCRLLLKSPPQDAFLDIFAEVWDLDHEARRVFGRVPER